MGTLPSIHPCLQRLSRSRWHALKVVADNISCLPRLSVHGHSAFDSTHPCLQQLSRSQRSKTQKSSQFPRLGREAHRLRPPTQVMIHQLHLCRRDRPFNHRTFLRKGVGGDWSVVTKHPWPMRSTNQTSGSPDFQSPAVVGWTPSTRVCHSNRGSPTDEVVGWTPSPSSVPLE